MNEKSLLPEGLAEERERQSGEQFKKALIRQGRVENFFGIPNKEDMSRLEEYKIWAGNNAWMGKALVVLRNVIKYQNKDGACEIPDDYFEKNAELLEISRTLLHDGFIRRAEASEGAFSQRITTRGLALYSVLDNLLLFDDGIDKDKMTKNEYYILRQSQALKIFAALSGTAR